MARMTSDLSNVQARECVPKDIYVGHFETCENMKGKEAPHNPYIMLSAMLEGDKDGGPSEFNGRHIRFVKIMTGGVSKKGEPLQLFELASVLEHFAVPATCLGCHTDAAAEGPAYDGRYDVIPSFIRGTGDDGIKKGQTVCAICKQAVSVSYDTANFIGKRGRLAVDIENDQKGNPQNVVKGYAPAP